jgi:hypothetical protein
MLFQFIEPPRQKTPLRFLLEIRGKYGDMIRIHNNFRREAHVRSDGDDQELGAPGPVFEAWETTEAHPTTRDFRRLPALVVLIGMNRPAAGGGVMWIGS